MHAQDQTVVRAVLFYSPTCPHCHKVIQEGLPPIVEQYGDQLQILLINTQTQGGSELYVAAAEWGGIPENQRGVPLMVVGDDLLFGSVEIPAKLPGIVEEGLSNGGIDWPAFPGMEEVVAELEAQQEQQPEDPAEEPTENPATSAAPTVTTVPATATPAPATNNDGIALIGESTPQTVADLSIAERLMVDPVGNAIALIVLALLIISAIWIAVSWIRFGLPEQAGMGWQVWIVPALTLIGMGVASYLAFVETTASEAVCGPVGDCNAVQNSPYAKLFGVLHIGVLGVIGYLVILALWLWQRLGPEASTRKTAWMLPAVSLFGVLFSIYLTFLEPFVIAAVCMWCITSAVIMMLLLWLTYLWRVPSR
ncbi:MAG TPA: vitamin K epoxide reductase [Caldilineae bacterium]|nr:vitamin K epoxide reductase [Caldilineae bacterium]